MHRLTKWIALGLLLAACVPEHATNPGEIGMLAATSGGGVVRNVTNGWNSADNLTLVQSGKILELLVRDFQYVDVDGGAFLSLDFGNIATDARVQSIKVHAVMFIEPLDPVEPCEPREPGEPPEPCGQEPPEPPEPGEPGEPAEPPETINPSVALLQIGGGSLSSPSVAMQKSFNVPATGTTHAIWDVTKWARNPARVNELKLIIRNMDPFGEGVISVDRAFIQITFGAPPSPVAMNWVVSLFPTNGWDAKNQKTLAEAGMLGAIAVRDSDAVDIAGGGYLSLQFNGIPSDATVSSVKVHILKLVEAQDPLEPPEPIDPTEPPEPAEPCGAFPLEPCTELPDVEPPGSAFLQVGSGDLISPTTSYEVHLDQLGNHSVWNVTPVARLASQVNSLKLVITNTDFLGAALSLNQVYLEVTFGPTPAPVPLDQTITIFASGGWDQKNGKTLAESGTLDYIRTMDGKSSEVGAGDYLTIEFGNIAADATVKSVKLRMTAYPEAGATPGAVLWQVGGGSLTAPFVAMEIRPELSGSTLTWDVTPWVRIAARVNDLKLIIRNLDPLGKKLQLDQASLQVTYGATRAKSTTGFPVTLFVTDGWDSKDLLTLATTGEVDAVNAVDGERATVEAGAFISYQFQGVPGNAVIQSARVHVRHHEEEGFAPGAAVWRVSGGTLQSPTTLSQRVPAVLSGELSEATVPWDVSGTINTVGRVNGLKFVARNNDLLGKKMMINRVHAVVTHKEP